MTLPLVVVPSQIVRFQINALCRRAGAYANGKQPVVVRADGIVGSGLSSFAANGFPVSSRNTLGAGPVVVRTHRPRTKYYSSPGQADRCR